MNKFAKRPNKYSRYKLLLLVLFCTIPITLFIYKWGVGIEDGNKKGQEIHIVNAKSETNQIASDFSIPSFRAASNPSPSSKQRIPRVVYQTGYSKNVSEKVYNNSVAGYELNPDYSFRFFDDAAATRFMQRRFRGRVYEAYRTLRMGAARADLWRYCVLFEKGGVYADLDVGITLPLRHKRLTADSEALLAHDNTGNLINWFMLFRPRHPFLARVISLCVDRISSRDPSVFSATGPTLLTEAFFLFYGGSQERGGLDLPAIRQMSGDQKVAFYKAHTPWVISEDELVRDMGVYFKFEDFEEHDLYELYGKKHYLILGYLKLTPELYFPEEKEAQSSQRQSASAIFNDWWRKVT